MGYKPAVVDKTKPKPKHKKGLWSPDEDQRLRNSILQHGHGCWSSVAINAGLQRNGKSCRLRWINYLRPGLKRGAFSAEEEDTIINLHHTLGNKWSQIAQHFPGRTDNEIKNIWHSHLKKKKLSRAIEVETISKTAELTNSIIQENDNESPAKSNSSNSSFDSVVKSEGSSVDSERQSTEIKSNLSKIFFAEWFTLDNIMFNDHDNIHENQALSSHNSEDIDLTYNLGLQERSSSEEVTMFNQDSCSNDDFFNGVENFIFDSQHKFEDQTSETRLGDLFLSGDDVHDDPFASNNLMCI